MGNCFSVSFSLDSLLLRCWDCAAQRALYVRQLEDNISSLRKEKDELIAKRDDVIRRVRSEEGPEMERTREVQNWLASMEASVTQVNELLEASPQEIEKLCLGGCCSKNYKSSYKFGVAVAEKLNVVREEKKKDFVKVVDKLPPELVVQQNVGHTVGTESMLDEAWRYLMGDDQVEALGIYGMGGVGKTTLLKQINNRFLRIPNNIYSVIFLTVSKDYQIGKLQEDIWKGLNFSVDERWIGKTCEEKAQAIFNVLSKKKFVLLLDDVWKPIKLAEEIGVPEDRNGSKVVITTRSQSVCSKMGMIGNRKQLKVTPLEWDEAWQLFCKMIGEETLSRHPDIPSLAQDVARECGGLPLSIITIARAMAPKTTPYEWRWAVQCLRKAASAIEDVKNEVLYRLKFSYDNLPNKSIQSCLLYCCLFPEDFEIDKDDLIDYWICEEFCINRDEGYDIIGTLCRACLLMEEGEGCVKMHDVIRDMALWITSECEEEKDEKFLVEAGCQLTEIRETERWKGKKRISLMKNNIQELKGAPSCPNLITLFLNENEGLQVLEVGFFQSMAALRVLDPSSFRSYQSVPVLIEISKLMCLQYLNLSRSDIKFLPPEVKMLVNLKYLNLEWTIHLSNIPRQVISSLELLQVLRMFGCGSICENLEEMSIQSSGCDLVEEFKCLKHLNVLSTTIREESTLKCLWNNPILSTSIEAVEIAYMNGLKSMDISCLMQMKKLKELRMYNATCLEDVKVDLIKERLEAQLMMDGGLHNSPISFCCNTLHTMYVSFCEYLVDLTWLILFPNLTRLEVNYCDNMREIINAEKLGEISDHGNLFAKLKSIDLEGLQKLERIYDNCLSFPSLQLIRVVLCSKLKKLPLNSNSTANCRLQIRGLKEWWCGLKWEDDATKTTFSSSFSALR